MPSSTRSRVVKRNIERKGVHQYSLRSVSRERRIAMANAGQSQQTGDASALRLDALEGAVNGINDRFDAFSDDIVARLQIELPQILQALQGGGGG